MLWLSRAKKPSLNNGNWVGMCLNNRLDRATQEFCGETLEVRVIKHNTGWSSILWSLRQWWRARHELHHFSSPCSRTFLAHSWEHWRAGGMRNITQKWMVRLRRYSPNHETLGFKYRIIYACHNKAPQTCAFKFRKCDASLSYKMKSWDKGVGRVQLALRSSAYLLELANDLFCSCFYRYITPISLFTVILGCLQIPLFLQGYKAN